MKRMCWNCLNKIPLDCAGGVCPSCLASLTVADYDIAALKNLDRAANDVYNTLMTLITDIRDYQPFNQQEVADKQVILHQLEIDPWVFERTSPAHLTCSMWTVDPTATKTLMVYHNIYHSWSWIGGHADGEHDLAQMALREVKEETGIANAALVPCGLGNIYSLEVLTVDGHVKREKYVSSHLHLNVTYLAVASPTEPLRAKPDENSGVRWVNLNEVCALSAEPWIAEHVYGKLIDKLHTIDIQRSLGK